MNNSRRYAEDLVGALKTEHYGTQRDVADKIYNTNWQNLENQYKNLKDKLEAKRVEENRAFASGLANTAESGYDMARANAQNLANRGLSVSGVQDLADKANTTVKGEQVLKLLDKLNNSTEANIEKLSDATSTMAKEEAKLNANLADTLGDIGAAQTNAQMNYNAGLADIAGAKDARDMENELAKLQREAQAAANARSSSGNDGVNAEIEDFYKRQAIISVLNGIDPITGKEIDWDDSQKANAIQILFGVSNAKDVVDTYEYNNNLSEVNSTNYENNNQRIKDSEKTLKEWLNPYTVIGTKGLSKKTKRYKESAKILEKAIEAGDYDSIAEAVANNNDRALGTHKGFIEEVKANMVDVPMLKGDPNERWENVLNAAETYLDAKKGPKVRSYKDLDILFYD